MLVPTIKGPIDRNQLEVKDVVTEDEGSRAVATEWYYNGELVRRDVWVNVIVTPAMTAEQEGVNG